MCRNDPALFILNKRFIKKKQCCVLLRVYVNIEAIRVHAHIRHLQEGIMANLESIFSNKINLIKDSLNKTGDVTIVKIDANNAASVLEEMGKRGWTVTADKSYEADSGKTKRVSRDVTYDDGSLTKSTYTEWYDKPVMKKVIDFSFHRDVILDPYRENLEQSIILLQESYKNAKTQTEVQYSTYQTVVEGTASGKAAKVFRIIAAICGLIGAISLFWLFMEAIPKKMYFAIAVPVVLIALAIVFLLIGGKLDERANRRVTKAGYSNNLVSNYSQQDKIHKQLDQKLQEWASYLNL